MSSLKMTFSLTSLILIFALVAVMPVMGHAPLSDGAPTPTDTRGHPDGLAQGAHQHPEIMVTIMDADPTTDGIQVVDLDVDTNALATATIEFDVMLTLPVGAEDSSAVGTAVSTSTFTTDPAVTGVAYYSDFLSVGAVTFADPTPADTATTDAWQVSADNSMLWTSRVTITLPTLTDDADPLTTDAQQAAAAITAAITKGIMVDINIPDNLIKTTALVTGPMDDQANLMSKTMVTVVSEAYVAPEIPDTTAPTITEFMSDGEVGTDGNLTFEITFSKALGVAGLGLDSNDLEITGGTLVADTEDAPNPSTDDDRMVWKVMVTPNDPDMPQVTVSITDDATIYDSATPPNPLDLMASAMYTSASVDAVHPMVASSSVAVMETAPMGAPAGTYLAFTFMFDEAVDLESFTADSIDQSVSHNVVINSNFLNPRHPMDAAGMDDLSSITITVRAKDPMMDSSVTLKAGSDGVQDMATNTLAESYTATYDVPGDPVPPIAITAMPDPINCETGSTISFAITGSGTLPATTAIRVSAGWKVGTDSDPSDGSITIVPDGNAAIGVTTVTVTVPANAIDANTETSKTFTVGPVLTIPAGGYITVIRPEHHRSNGGMTHLGDPLIVGSLGVRGGVVDIQTWECMPDLHNFYRRTPPGSGGGALVVKQSAEHTGAAIGKGTVGISEIMWAIDLGETFGGLPASGLSNLDHTREQWIELHNLNAHEVKVTLFARPTTTALDAPESDEIDRVSNYIVGNAWDVKGQNGDSARGVDFIAMQRSTPKEVTGKNYAHGDFNGSNAGKWSVSTHPYLTRVPELVKLGQQLAEENRLYDFVGTPGRSNKVAAIGAPTPTPVPRSPFVINEVANRDNRLYEWIEIRNSSTGEANLRNYLISTVTAGGTETAIYTFPNVDIKLPANGLILVVASDPEDDAEHPLTVGHDVRGGNDQAPGVNANSARYIVAGSSEKLHTEGLPDDGKFVLFLRRSEKADKANAKDKIGKHEWVIDIAGYHDNLTHADTPYSDLWPLKAFPAPKYSHNSISVNEVHFRRHADIDGTKTKDGNKHDKTAMGNAGYTGIGYRRHATNSAAHGGTPGYHDIRRAKVADHTTGTVTISEVMFDQGDRDNYPQWIELYNSSATESVNLHADDGWRLQVHNYDDGEVPIDMLSGTLNFKSSEVQTLLPQQTVLIASTRARNAGSSSVNAGIVFIPTRVFSVWADARGALGMKRSTDAILSKDAFYLRLIDGKGNVADQAGNLTQRRVRGAEAYWEWSDVQGEAMDARSSVMRRYRAPEEGVRSAAWERFDDDELFDMGIEADGWVNAAGTEFRNVERTWYGHEDDYGTPGATAGRPLPVSLSKFRPERLDDGSIVIRWITESELNNAGFNILRSETRNGAYTQINTSLIAGKGTTTEQSLYEWKDTSAKPNVVYYYQIQDVSLDGKVTTLRQGVRLKGNVSAAGKLTTIWGEIKALQ